MQERRFGREDVGQAILVEECQALVGERARRYALLKGVHLRVAEYTLEITFVGVLREGLHERGLAGEEVAHDAYVEVSRHDF